MGKPSYDEVIAEIAPGFDWKAMEGELDSLKKEFRKLPDGPDKKFVQDKYNRIELMYKFILPDDFRGALLDYALSITESGIKDVSDKMLVDAATLAILGHDNPHDHVNTQLLTEEMIIDFDNRAWIEYYRVKKQNQKGA